MSTHVSEPATCDLAKLKLGGLDAAMAHRIVRFVRLSRSSAGALSVLDRVVSALGGDLTVDFLCGCRTAPAARAPQAALSIGSPRSGRRSTCVDIRIMTPNRKARCLHLRPNVPQPHDRGPLGHSFP